MAKKYPFKHPIPRFSVGDVVDVKTGPIGVMTPDNWDQGEVTHVRTYQAGPVYTVRTFDGTIVKAEDDDLRPADV
jgi:hypothetical protein